MKLPKRNWFECVRVSSHKVESSGILSIHQILLLCYIACLGELFEHRRRNKNILQLPDFLRWTPNFDVSIDHFQALILITICHIGVRADLNSSKGHIPMIFFTFEVFKNNYCCFFLLWSKCYRQPGVSESHCQNAS